MAQIVATAVLGRFRFSSARAILAQCPRHCSPLCDRAAFGELPPDLYVVPGPWRCLGRPVKHDVETWRALDDWLGCVPVTDDEIDVFESWFGALFRPSPPGRG